MEGWLAKANAITQSFTVALAMLQAPSKTLEELGAKTTPQAFAFLLTVGAVTALLTPLQISLGFEDINGLHAGGAAEYLAKDLSSLYQLGLEWRPLLIELLYVFVLLFSTGLLHLVLRAVGGRGSLTDTLKMIAYGDAPGLLFGWIPYFATIAALWAAVIQLLLGPVALHKISWAKAIIIFSSLVGLGLIEIALS